LSNGNSPQKLLKSNRKFNKMLGYRGGKRNRFQVLSSCAFLSTLVTALFCNGQDGFGLTGNADIANFPSIVQPDGISCGPVCCAMLLKYYGKSAGTGPLKTAAGTRFYQGPNATGQQIKVGLTLPSGIKNAIASYGVFPVEQQGTIDDVERLINSQKPPILLVRSGSEFWHYVIAIGHRYNNRSGRREIKLADPADSQPYWIEEGKLDAAWTFSHDLKGNSMQGRKCRHCGGSGSLAVGPVKTKCVLCNGDGRETDYYRKIVESAGASGHTMVWVKHPTRGVTGQLATGAPSTVEIRYTILNDTGRTVNFSMQPSGKSYTLRAGKTFSGTSRQIDGKAPTITLADSGKTTALRSGKHKFWWKRDESRVALDLNYEE
jgi:hypothetical protein